MREGGPPRYRDRGLWISSAGSALLRGLARSRGRNGARARCRNHAVLQAGWGRPM